MLNHIFQEVHDSDEIAKLYSDVLIPQARESSKLMTWVRGSSERNPSLTKLVVKEWPSFNCELRVNFYEEGSNTFEIHDHRWPFYSLILAGTLNHTTYSYTNGTLVKMETTTYSSGDVYGLAANMFHKVVPANYLVTLLLRGPIEKESWTFRRQTGEPTRTMRGTRDRGPFILSDVEAMRCLEKTGGLLAGP